MSIRNLDALFEPRSVAVVGASSRPGSVGATVWQNLLAGRFKGTLLPVNPKYRELDGIGMARRCAIAMHQWRRVTVAQESTPHGVLSRRQRRNLP